MKKDKNQRKRDFLLTFFDKPDKYESKEVNGFTLVRQYSNASNRWEVAIYTPESYKKAQEFIQGIKKPDSEGNQLQERLVV